jgi:hypothetical protein
VAVVTVGLAYATYMVAVFGLGIIRSVGRGEPFWWLYFILVLVPSVLIYASTIKFLKSEKKPILLMNNKVKAATFVILAGVPLSFTAVFLVLLYLL